MLYIIGTGLNSYMDLSLRSLEIIKRADKVYQECYTCIQLGGFQDFREIIDKEVIAADRKLVEETNQIVDEARDMEVVFMVAGTPFFATTHADIYIRAKERGVETVVIHNISILNVKGCYGLYSYNFGRTVSIPYFTEKVKPTSFYDNITTNHRNHLHTLCLLDIKTDENKYMTVNEGLEQILYAEEQIESGVVKRDTKVLAVCRFATDEEYVCYETVEKLLEMDFGGPLHSIIIPAKLSCIEEELVGEMFSK